MSPSRGEPPTPRAVVAARAAVWALLGLYATEVVLGADVLGDALLEDAVYNALLLGAAGLCLWRAAAGGGERLAWAVLGAGMLSWTAGNVYWTAALRDAADPPFPSPADALWLGFYPCAFVALVVLVRARSRHTRWGLWTDGLIGVLALTAVGSHALLEPVVEVTGGSPAAVATNIAYPLADLLLVGFAVAVSALTGWWRERWSLLLAAALIVLGVADTIYLARVSTETYQPGTALDVLWPAGMLLLVEAAWRWRPARGVQADPSGWRGLGFAASGAVLALASLVHDALGDAEPIAPVAAAAALVLAIGRLIVALRREERALRTSEEQFRSLVENASDVVTVLDDAGVIRFQSGAFERWFGHPARTFVGAPLASLVHPDDHRALRAALAGTAAADGTAVVMRWRHADGSWRHVETLVSDRLHDPHVAGIVLTSRDVTERVALEQRLRESQVQLETVVDSAEMVLFALDRDGTFTLSEGRGLAAIGLAGGEVVGRSVWDVYAGAPPILDQCRRALAGEAFSASVEIGPLVYESRYTPIPGPDGEPAGIVGVALDVTERRRHEQALERSFELLRSSDRERRALLANLVRAQEDERKRIAADIHDDSVQVMTAVALRLELQRLPGSRPPDGEAQARLEQSVRLSIGRLRHLIFELRPPSLDRVGLEAATDLYLRQLAEDAGLRVALRATLDAEPPDAIRTVIYRIVREALTNVRKHARATHVDVRLASHDGGVLLEVADDGVGPSVRGPEEPGHLGLTTMRERAEMCGGWWRLLPGPHGGSVVRAWVPLDGDGDDPSGDPVLRDLMDAA